MDINDRIRSDQASEGRRRTLTAKKNPNANHNTPRRPAIPKGHDAILKQAMDAKATISVMLASGVVEEGVITGRDKYTITINRTNVIYKHAIDRFVIPLSVLSEDK